MVSQRRASVLPVEHAALLKGRRHVIGEVLEAIMVYVGRHPKPSAASASNQRRNWSASSIGGPATTGT
ncbi:MAG: hypothetical protein JWS10_301 [Cypionkella sp.]|nr:hypothetical protein [Cypionkella sp.]